MSEVFFDQLGMSAPNFMLHVGSGKHGEQTAKMILEIEKICLQEAPNALMVYGDTNSTLAGAIVASKLHIPVVHVEAGLRSFNKKMPEEVNRIMTDHISELLLVPSKISVENLQKEGLHDGVFIVGDIMKDLVHYIQNNELAKKPDIQEPYYYTTLHRPYNVDSEERLYYILDNLNKLKHKVIFAAHPRTLARLNIKKGGAALLDHENISVIPPQGYLENMGYLIHAEALITDSGGMQKEAYWLKKKCITIRSETEWLETLKKNANSLLFEDLSQMSTLLNKDDISWDSSLYGDGRASQKIVDIILKTFVK